METDNSIQNQKVFVKLAAVLQLQAEYHKTVTAQRAANPGSVKRADLTATRLALENAIIILGLPIQLTFDTGKGGEHAG